MSYRIPLFDLNYGEAELQALAETIRDNWISMGPRCARLEAAFAAALGVPHAVAVDNCTNALFLALRILGVGPGDEVLVPSLTFVATVNCVRYVGAEPVFCDVAGPHDPCIDPDEVRRRITRRTRAVIVMHYAGFPCRMDAVMATAREHGLRVVEDACHGPLSEYRGAKLGTLGDIGCFSFFSNKNISTGEGGMMVMAGADLDARARLLRSHGMTSMSYQRAGGHATDYDVVDLGYNFRMDDLRAALGLVQLGRLPDDLARRARVRAAYLEGLAGVPAVIVPFRDHAGPVSNYVMPVVLREGTAGRRDAVRARLHAAGVQTSVHYPPVHRFSIYRARAAALPATEQVADREITLPMYGKLDDADVRYVVAALAQALEQVR